MEVLTKILPNNRAAKHVQEEITAHLLLELDFKLKSLVQKAINALILA